MAEGSDGQLLARAFEGKTFAGYRIARAIATGGMATVFLARRTGPGRFAQTAALKIIHPHLAHEREFVDMFLEEARIASSINHPNVCRVLDFGQAEGTFYLAMEYVRGETWATTLATLASRRETRTRLQTVSTYVIAQACEGLHAVHEAVDQGGAPLGIVHRDVSPQNLFVAYDGSVRVLDFGIASARDRAQGSTTSVVKGRYAYMAPEQARGLELDRRADIWSLGVVLREALSGERLFERDTQVGTILAVTKDPLPPWPRHVPLLLREICDRALEREPDRRFATARELGSALTRYVKSELEPLGGAELARLMRGVFPEQIAKKRAELRELAGDDTNTGTYSIPIPPRSQSETPTLTGSFVQPARSSRARMLRTWGGATLGALMAAGLAFWVTPRLLGPAATGAPLPARAAVRAGVDTALRPELAAGITGGTGAPPGTAVPLADVPDGPAHVPDGPAHVPGGPAHVPGGPAHVPGGSVSPGALAPGVPVVTPGAAALSEPADDDSAEARRERRRLRRERRAAEAAAAAAAAGNGSTPPIPPAASTSAAEPKAAGTLVVGAADGWAQVAIDGTPLGTTPLRTQLPAGAHQLEVSFFGSGTPQRMRVEIKPGEITKLRLEP